MRVLPILAYCLSVGCFGCGPGPVDEWQEEQAEGIAESQSELFMANGDASCSGYTSGRGQRVDGFIHAFSTDMGVIDGVRYYKHYVDLSAVNWKKNIGWNTKRTTQLRIEGTISGSGYSIPVQLDTGGELTTSIGRLYYLNTSTFQNEPKWIDVTFYGRDGTHCTL